MQERHPYDCRVWGVLAWVDGSGPLSQRSMFAPRAAAPPDLSKRHNALPLIHRRWEFHSRPKVQRKVLQGAAKRSTEHVCRECGHTETRHYGRCPSCLRWNTMIERLRRRRNSDSRSVRDELASTRRPRLWGAQIPPTALSGDDLERWLQNADALPLSLGVLQQALQKVSGGTAAASSSADGAAEEALVSAGTAPSTPSAAGQGGIAIDSGRLLTQSAEFNRVTGGGIVPGSLLLLGGEPGNGKSTLMLQIAGDVAATGLRVLYVSAEESVEQVGARAARLFGLHEIQPSRQLARIQYIQKNLLMMHEARLEHILDVVEDLQSALRHDGTGAAAEAGAVWQPVTPTAAAKKAATNVFGQGESATGANHDDDDSSHEATLSPLVLLIVDSIQTVYSREDGMESSAPGSVAQVRQCTNRLLELAKRQQRFREPHQRTAILLIGHVTKSGDLAGPKLLEHMVDVVLYLESEQGLLQHRILRCTKNRFGPTDIGIFDLTAQGLLDVPNPSLLYFQPPETDLNSDYDPSATTASALPSTFVQSAVDGVAFSMVMDGTRAFLVEIQALVVKTSLSQPRRTSNGFDLSRLNVILAVLSKRAHLRLETFDVYVNVVGGARIQDPAADLATAVALASSLLTKSPRLATAFIGELGLQGEIRPVPRLDLRLRDIARLGFRYCVCSDRLSQSQEAKARDAGLEIIRCGHINEALAFGIPASKHRAA